VCFVQCCSYQPGAGDQDQIQVGGNIWDQGAHGFTQEPLGPVSMNGGPYCPSSRHPDFYAGMVPRIASLIVSLNYQHNKRVGIGLAGTPHPLEVFGPGQTKFSLHPLPRTRLSELTAYQRTFLTCLLAVTVNCLRPRSRRRFRTARPSAVAMRWRNPCTRTRRRIFGWYVRFGILRSSL